MEIYRVSRAFPLHEKYSLTDQIRRSSRSVCANLREAWAKRRYEAHFISKLTDADGENSETDTWLDFARSTELIDSLTHSKLTDLSREIGAMIGQMIKNPEPFLQDHKSPETRKQRSEVRSQRSDVRPPAADS